NSGVYGVCASAPRRFVAIATHGTTFAIHSHHKHGRRGTGGLSPAAHLARVHPSEDTRWTHGRFPPSSPPTSGSATGGTNPHRPKPRPSGSPARTGGHSCLAPTRVWADS